MGTRVLYTLFIAFVLLAGAGISGDEKTWKEGSTNIGDIKMHYFEGGSGDRNIVFIPGLTMTAEVWKEQFPYLAARGFHLIAIDPRSQGLTSKTDGGNTYAQHAADLHAFLEKMRLEHCTLVGWGAGVVTLLEYVSSPEALRPDALVFVGDVPIHPGDKEIPSRFTVPLARETALAMEGDRAKATEAMVHGLFKSQQNGQLYKDLITACMKTPTGTAISLLFDLTTGDRRTTLASVIVATLVIVPEDERQFGEYLQSRIAGAKLQVVADAGSALFLEKPQTFNQALEDFIGK